tara:strand:- start:5100 stop:5789 length:690 start_codon:yes stop_codon:yes gene_type:complete
MHRGDLSDTLQESHPEAFLLLCQIAKRARIEECPIRGLEVGEALLGDFKTAGIATMRKYRTAKKNLLAFKLATFRATSKGTVGKLVDARVFSTRREDRDNQSDKQATNGRQAGDKQATTKKNVRKEEGKNERNNTVSDETKVTLLELWNKSPKPCRARSSKKQVMAEWKKVKAKPDRSTVVAAIIAWSKCSEWQRDDGQAVQGLHLWIKNERWEDLPDPARNKIDHFSL